MMLLFDKDAKESLSPKKMAKKLKQTFFSWNNSYLS